MPKENMPVMRFSDSSPADVPSGYEMKHTIDTNLNHFWKTTSDKSIRRLNG